MPSVRNSHEEERSLASEIGDLRDAVMGLKEQVDQVLEALQLIYSREPENRERLRRLRKSPEYERAYTDPSPLVSIVIPTYDNYEQLRERSLPSALDQSYPNIEVVVVGDSAPQETEDAIASFGDPRISYRNLNRRGPYPEDRNRFWRVAGVPPRNEAVYQARGSWIAHLDDDDSFRTHHVERLLEAAVSNRFEVCYGRMTCHLADGRQFEIGEFPPTHGHFGWQGAIFHKGLSLFETELADALFGLPADWALCQRMLRAGVRFGMVDESVTDYFPALGRPGEPALPGEGPKIDR